MLSKTTQGFNGEEENNRMGDGHDLGLDVEKEYGGEEYEVLSPHRPKKQHGKKTDTGEDERQAAMGQTCKDLLQGFKRLDEAGHGGCIPTGD